MQFRAVALSFFAAVAVAQSSDNSTSLPDLVSQLPTCAIPCFEQGAEAAGCSTTDFACLCGDGMDTFVSKAASCVFGKCSSEELNTAIKSAEQICLAVADSPNPTEVASASAIITSALGAADPTSSPESTDSPDSAAFRPEINFGILGAALAMLVF